MAASTSRACIARSPAPPQRKCRTPCRSPISASERPASEPAKAPSLAQKSNPNKNRPRINMDERESNHPSRSAVIQGEPSVWQRRNLTSCLLAAIPQRTSKPAKGHPRDDANYLAFPPDSDNESDVTAYTTFRIIHESDLRPGASYIQETEISHENEMDDSSNDRSGPEPQPGSRLHVRQVGVEQWNRPCDPVPRSHPAYPRARFGRFTLNLLALSRQT